MRFARVIVAAAALLLALAGLCSVPLLLQSSSTKCHLELSFAARSSRSATDSAPSAGSHSDTHLTVYEVLEWAAAGWGDHRWRTAERPIPDERSLTTPQFEANTVHSINPPKALQDTKQPLAALELQSRLVIGIAAAVHSGSKDPSAVSIPSLPLINTALATLIPTLQPSYNYRMYLAFDDVDPFFSLQSSRDAVEAEISKAVAAEDAKRSHPRAYQHGVTLDPSTLLVSVHWVICNYTGKPAWAQSDAAMAAYKEGADYVFRTNDDTQLPTHKDWVSVFIRDLRSRLPFPNVGVVGPACDQGNTAILTHDFTHRTHALIHGFHYPHSFATWYGDDWVTKVYIGYSNPALMVKRHDVSVVHKLAPQRYDAALPPNILEVLDRELRVGQEAIRNFTQQHFNAAPTRM